MKNNDPMKETLYGETLNGGDYVVVVYLDKNRKPVPKSKAYYFSALEYKDDKVIDTTWGVRKQ